MVEAEPPNSGRWGTHESAAAVGVPSNIHRKKHMSLRMMVLDQFARNYICTYVPIYPPRALQYADHYCRRPHSTRRYRQPSPMHTVAWTHAMRLTLPACRPVVGVPVDMFVAELSSLLSSFTGGTRFRHWAAPHWEEGNPGYSRVVSASLALAFTPALYQV